MELWLYETPVLTPGWGFRMRIRRVLETFESKFQKGAVYESFDFGKVLTLDGVVQLTELDEPHYHEMIVHVPMMAHPRPEKVLVIGGGDGGVVREIVRHKCVKEVHFCEIDEMVVKVCQKHFPALASGLADPRVKHLYGDGLAYVKKCPATFDVVIVDSTDPIGPAVGLFEKPFFEDIRRSLRPGGIFVNQAENCIYPGEFEVVKRLFAFTPELFSKRGYYWSSVPTYPAGFMGFTFLSNETDPYRTDGIDWSRLPEGLHYYTPQIHQASFVLPRYVHDALDLSCK